MQVQLEPADAASQAFALLDTTRKAAAYIAPQEVHPHERLHYELMSSWYYAKALRLNALRTAARASCTAQLNPAGQSADSAAWVSHTRSGFGLAVEGCKPLSWLPVLSREWFDSNNLACARVYATTCTQHICIGSRSRSCRYEQHTHITISTPPNSARKIRLTSGAICCRQVSSSIQQVPREILCVRLMSDPVEVLLQRQGLTSQVGR